MARRGEGGGDRDHDKNMLTRKLVYVRNRMCMQYY
jgi:hypothetical protein